MNSLTGSIPSDLGQIAGMRELYLQNNTLNAIPCVRNLFDATEMASLEATVSAAAARERLNSYRHRVAVLCPGVDPFTLHSVSEAEAVIRQKVTFLNHHKPRNAYV